MKLLTSIVLLLAITTVLSQKSKIRKLSESNLEAFSKDNSYWLIQIAGTPSPTQREDVPSAPPRSRSWSSWRR